MKIDLTITYDDLSDKCKKEIEHLKSLGYDVELTYPILSKKMPSINTWPAYDPNDPNNWVYCQTGGSTTAGYDHNDHKQWVIRQTSDNMTAGRHPSDDTKTSMATGKPIILNEAK